MSCPVNIAPPEEDPNPPFRIAYRPCGVEAYADVKDGNGRVICMCKPHAVEAEREGCEVDWP